VVVGHDFGSRPAWGAAIMRPDRIRGVVGLSVPFVPRGPRPEGFENLELGRHQVLC